MPNLQAFLAQNAEKAEIVEKVVSKRFKDENGNPIPWHFGAITGEEEDKIRKACTSKKPVPGKKGMFMPETDGALFATKLTVATIKFPDLHDASLQDSYGVKTAEALLGVMLLPGELTDAKQFAQEVNGYSVDFDDLVEEAKN